jgi:prepilin-type processing-associated H-X9-DG protein
LLSWRVLILPYLHEDVLYHRFKLDEPWDGPHNKPLLARMPDVFEPPLNDRAAAPGTTFYQVLVGKGTAFQGDEGLQLPGDFPDGTANILLVVEAGEAVPWTAPFDVPCLDNEAVPSLGGIFNHEGRFSLFGESRELGLNVAFADGSVRFFRGRIPEAELRAFITRFQHH